MLQKNLSSQFADYVFYHDSIAKLYVICVSLSVCLINYGFENSPIQPIVDPEVKLLMSQQLTNAETLRKMLPLVRSSDTLSFLCTTMHRRIYVK